MDIFVLMAQRKERYEGQFDLEALACMSEAGQDDNPAYLADALAEHQASGEFDAVAVVRLTVSRKAINNALYPSIAPIPADVKEP